MNNTVPTIFKTRCTTSLKIKMFWHCWAVLIYWADVTLQSFYAILRFILCASSWVLHSLNFITFNIQFITVWCTFNPCLLSYVHAHICICTNSPCPSPSTDYVTSLLKYSSSHIFAFERWMSCDSTLQEIPGISSGVWKFCSNVYGNKDGW
jgi:hypothetical protein